MAALIAKRFDMVLTSLKVYCNHNPGDDVVFVGNEVLEPWALDSPERKKES